MFNKYIDINKRNIINSVCDLITFPSISVETSDHNFPFGKPCSDCLKYFLNIANSLGFRTKNLDGYCGYAEFGEGNEIIGIVGHLDVVPANEDDWNYSPFVPTIENNCIYGRGAIDDKGPVTASLYAMKAVFDYCNDNNIKLNKRVRLIVGLNEEKDWKCINYYKINEELPTIGFSPDSDFPCIYAEKGVLSLTISDKLSNNLPIIIESVDCANNAINVVPEFCSIVLKINNNIQMDYLINNLKNIISKYNYEIDIYKIDNKTVKLTSYGVSSHSAHPELGVNAITKLLVVLNDLFSKFNIKCPLLSTFCSYIGDDYLGTNMNINFSDESGHLTLNTSRIYIENNKLHIGVNLRIPAQTTINNIIDIFEKTFTNFNVQVLAKQEPLHTDKNSKLVTTLCNIFNETCGTTYEPRAIGGATYARAFDNCVCFGMNFPGDKDMCHQTDEFININKLFLATNIYAKAIYKLLDVEEISK